jgi:hypothetical protein
MLADLRARSKLLFEFSNLNWLTDIREEYISVLLPLRPGLGQTRAMQFLAFVHNGLFHVHSGNLASSTMFPSLP